ncbi:hypothetical protein GIB67_017441, partial [Kingdonia uniflora]
LISVQSWYQSQYQTVKSIQIPNFFFYFLIKSNLRSSLMATQGSSNPTMAINNIANLVPIKLTKDNCILWKSLWLPIL